MAQNSKVKKTSKLMVLKRIITIVVLGIIVLFIFNIFINLYQGHAKIKEMDTEIKNLNQDITQLNKKTKQLEEEIKYISSNKCVEEIARKELGLVKKDEMLYVIVEEESN